MSSDHISQLRTPALSVAQNSPAATDPVPPPPLQMHTAPASPMHKRRHWGMAISFVTMVLFPTGLAAIYLLCFAADQYASRVGFVVRQEESANGFELMGGLPILSATSSSDTDILYEYIQSPEMVTAVDRQLDLRALWSLPRQDPIFRFDPDDSAEALQDYWNRMVRIYHDQSTGLIELRVLAFTPGDAHRIANAIVAYSSNIINELSAIAHEDTTRHAQEELELSIARLKAAREALTAFRLRTQIIDPAADINGQMGVLGLLHKQLTEAWIEHDLLAQTTRHGDTRLEQIQRRIQVIEGRISQEREKFSTDTADGSGYAMLMSEFEHLSVDRQYAEEAYTIALAALDTARAETRRQSRYLATYLRPTRPDTAQYPERLHLIGITGLFLLLVWSVLTLIYFSMRDRR